MLKTNIFTIQNVPIKFGMLGEKQSLDLKFTIQNVPIKSLISVLICENDTKFTIQNVPIKYLVSMLNYLGKNIYNTKCSY